MSQADPTSRTTVADFVDATAALTRPERIHWCDGSQAEYDALCAELVTKGTFTQLSSSLRPRSYLARTDPRDVARVEERTFVCSTLAADAGPTNNWRDPEAMRDELGLLFDGCMAGRTLYVVPFCLGPIGSRWAVYGVQVTDSAYVAVSMRHMTRMGTDALKAMQKEGKFVPCVHSVGKPLSGGAPDTTWPCDPDRTVIAHFPDEREIWSFGSGYGGNALLSKKCLALRLASAIGRDENWLAEHMMVSEYVSPRGLSVVVAAALPSSCGKTNLALLSPPASHVGWHARVLGDDIAWLRVDDAGRLRAVNPEAGMFGVAPGTSWEKTPIAMKTIESDALFTNVALTPEGDVWWEGLSEKPPQQLTDWRGEPWTPGCGRLAAHPNARFTVSLSRCPSLHTAWDDPEGLVVDALAFGGRRTEGLPLVIEALSWDHGVALAATMSSETTAAAAGKQGIVRYDPFAMLPFRGIDAGASFEQWLKLASSLTVTPRIFRVNWFLKDAQGKFVWPGFGENIRVIDWMMRRVKGLATARPTPLGLVPARDDFALPNDMAPSAYDTLFDAHRDIGLREAASKRRYLTSLGSSVPAALHAEIASEEKRLLEMPGGAGSPSASSKDSNGSAHARLRLGDVAVPAPIVVTPDTPLGTLERLMLENEIRHLPVVDGGRVVGLVSDRDVRWGRADNGKPTAAQVMSTDPYVASERADLAEVLSRLAEQKWGSVIMASDDGAVQGIFTTTDALNLLARRLGPG